MAASPEEHPGALQADADANAMMTLAALAANSGPVWDDYQAQEQSIWGSLEAQLGNANLATGGEWQLLWVGLTENGANLSYIVQNVDAPAQTPWFALSIRGTLAGNTTDAMQDTQVEPPAADFSAELGLPADTVHVSQGAYDAFVALTGATYDPADGSPLDGTTLEGALTSLVASADSANISVTGHSLGGAAATTIGLYLAKAVTWGSPVTIQVHTFAAPTAGLDDFATYFDDEFSGSDDSVNASWRLYNCFDIVPTAWVTSQMSAAEDWYPGGPLATTAVKDAINAMIKKPQGLPYTQPSVNPIVLNDPDNPLMDGAYRQNTTTDFEDQLGFQHDNNTYLELLGAPAVIESPPMPADLSARSYLSSSHIDLSWSPGLSYSGGGGSVSYDISRASDDSPSWELITSTADTSYQDTGLSPLTTYTYAVQATDDIGYSPPAVASATTA